jgi:transcriptional regulator with XRE-family HTH domain
LTLRDQAILKTPAQIRAGRHLAGLSQADIAAATGLSLPTIKRAETERNVSVSAEAVAAICKAIEAAGVVFIPENGGGVGVRLAKHDPAKAVTGPSRGRRDGPK